MLLEIIVSNLFERFVRKTGRVQFLQATLQGLNWKIVYFTLIIGNTKISSSKFKSQLYP